MNKKVESEYQEDDEVEHEEDPSKQQVDDDENPQDNQECSKEIQGVTIFCSLCYDYLSHSVTTFCEHTFCEICLNQYLLFLDECPECRLKIRNQKQASNILLDNLILDYIKKFQPEDLEQYEKRLDDYKEYKKRRTITELDTGLSVDIRDLDYVWCTGKVVRTINKYHERKIKYAVIKYDKSGNKREEIPENSPRLAPRGFYSDRQDIPKYERGKLVLKNPEEGVSYLIAKDSQEQHEEQQRKGQV